MEVEGSDGGGSWCRGKTGGGEVTEGSFIPLMMASFGKRVGDYTHVHVEPQPGWFNPQIILGHLDRIQN